jgi:signal transduction histidine kinase
MAHTLSPAPSVLPDALRVVSMFADLDDADLAWIAERLEVIDLEPGDVLFRAGDAADWMLIPLSGTLQLRRENLGPNAPLFTFRAGDVSGVIPFSRMTHATGTGRAITRARIARFPKRLFGELLRRIPVLETRFVSHLADRVREATRRDQQFEKTTALGKLAAGIAHELNNPAAAARRSAAELRGRLDTRARVAASLLEAGITADAVLALDALRATHTRSSRALDPIQRSDREDDLASWLTRVGVADAWLTAATFVDAGLEVADLERALAGVPDAARAAALAWLEGGLAVDALLLNLENSVGRVSDLVQAVKAYTHMDRGSALEEVDIRDGLESTLAIFRQRIIDGRLALESDIDQTLPRVWAYPGELNQVWANLLDNAIDAAALEGGSILMRAAQQDGEIVVEVRDNGPGIPPDRLDHIWEPFFTTKDVGRGTGLGLEIARRIVVEQHGGQIDVQSEPGNTRFIVRLPVVRPVHDAA